VSLSLIHKGWLSWIDNGAVIFIMYKQRNTDYLTFNLAISDASISIFGYSRGIIEIFNVFMDDGFLITSLWTCQVDGFLILLFGLISINTLTAINIKGCQPHQVHRVDKRLIAVTIIVIWLTALFWSAAPLLGWGSYTDHKYGTCEIDWIRAMFSATYKSYIIGVFIFGFFLPVLVMVFSYVPIIKTVRSSHKSTQGGDISKRQQMMEQHITRVSFVICIAFFLAWSPYAVISLWSACEFRVPAITSILASLFAKSASLYNPFTYIGMSSKFCKDLQDLFQCSTKAK
uniref:Opsin 6, group member b n=1 Tax=Latimeria chalumnae TaxID=7897 RepID=H3AUJ3_LATCH